MNYKEEYYKQLLENIHFLVHINNQYLTDEQIEKADKEIMLELMQEFDHEDKKARLIKDKKRGNVTYRNIYPFVVKYFAIANNNQKLLDRLNEIEFNFNGADSIINLYPLDKEFSSEFDEELYIKLLDEQPKIMKRFYSSLHFMDDEERKKSIKDFAEILKKNPDICKRKSRRKKDDRLYINLLTKRNIEYFGKDFLINATPAQKEVINELNYVLQPQDLVKIKQLLEKYPYYYMNIKLDSVILSTFTIDEIAKMPLKDCMLYEAALSAGLFNRMREILKENPSFFCSVDFITPEIFGCLDNKTILGLSREAKEEIADLKMPKSKQAVIFPHRKINRLVIKDRRRQKKKERNGFQKTK